MERCEILTRYRWLMQEAETLNRQADRVMGIGLPAGIASTWPKPEALKGMPRGTNDPAAASAQAFDGYIQHLRSKAERIMEICSKFEETLELLTDDRDRVICRKYYALGLTDEQIAEESHLDRSTVTLIRNAALAKL